MTPLGSLLTLLLLPIASPIQDETPKADRSLVPGVVIDHAPASSRQYIGSPSIAALPGGLYVASHDLFGPGSTKDTTIIFASNDGGASWTRITAIQGQWWSTLFFHRAHSI